MADPLLSNPQLLSPSDPTDLGEDAGRFLIRQRQAAQLAANDGLDEDADGAATAQDLAHATGDNAQLIYSDLENYQRQHKAILTSELLKQNQTLRDYALAHPLNPVVSNDDWGQLDSVSSAIKAFGKDNVIGHTIDMYKALKEGWTERFGEEPIGSSIDHKDIEWWKTNFPNLSQWVLRPIVGGLVGNELLSRASSGALGALHGGLVEAQKKMGVSEQGATQRANDLIGMFESYLMRTAGAPELPGAAAAGVHDVARYVEPWTEAGKHPLPGHPTLDPMIAEDSKLQMKNLDQVQKETQKSSTFERSPDAYRQFLDAHPEIRGRMMGIDLEGIEKIYPEGKVPEAGDGILGDVPDIARKIDAARQHGGDVEVPVSDIVMAEPEAYKELHDYIRTWPAGMTIEETKNLKPPEEGQGPMVAAMPADQIRQAANLRPSDMAGEKSIIPEDAQRGTVEHETEAVPALSFFARDALARVEPKDLTGVPRALHEFLGNRLETMAGDTPVYVVSPKALGDIAEQQGLPRNASAIYHGGLHSIVIADDVASGAIGHNTATHVLYHELAHAATFREMEEFPHLKQAVRDLMNEADKEIRKTDHANMDWREPTLRVQHSYAFTNPHEFIAEAFSYPKFQEILSGIPISKELGERLGLDKKPNTLWDAVRGIIKDLITKLTGAKPSDTIMDGLLRLGPTFEEAQRRRSTAPTGAAGMEEPIEPGAMGTTQRHQAKLLDLIAKEAERNVEYQRKFAERQEAKRQTKEWKENESAVREKATSDLQSRPDIAADRFLREGQLYGEKVRRVRLDEGALSDEQKAGLSPEHYGPGGMRPDDAAGLFGYRSGDALVTSLSDLEGQRRAEALTPKDHFNRMRDVEVERRMQAKYGKLGENILAEAKEQALNPTTMDRLHEEMVAHGMKYGLKEEGPITKADVKAWAKQTFDDTPVREHDSEKYFATLGRLGKKIEEAILDDKPTDAYKLMQQRYKTAELAQLALKYEKERAASDRRLKGYARRVIPGGNEEFTNWGHELLRKGGFTTADERIGGDYIKRTAADLAERKNAFGPKTFLDFAKEKSSVYGLPMDFSDNVFDDGWKKPQNSMTYAEWKGWSGAVQTIFNYGRDANKMTKMGREIEWEGNLRPRMVEQLKKETPGEPKPYRPTKGLLGKLNDYAARIQYRLVLMDSIWQRADHGNPYGLFQSTFAYDAAERVGTFGIWLRDFSKDLGKLSEFDTDLRKRVENSLFVHPRTRVPIQMDKENVRKVITYLGTKTGEQKVIRGWILPEKYAQEHYDVAKQALYDWLGKVSDKSDWDFAQGLWDINGKIYDKYEQMMTNVGAVPAQKEVLNPIQIHGKNYKGGYVKLQYDPDVEGTSKKLMGSFDPEDAMGDSGFLRASTPKSHEKQRTGYAGPLYLRLDRDNAAMTNVLRDAAIRPFIINASKAFYDNTFRDAVQQFGGTAVRDMLDGYLKSVAGMGPRMSRSDLVMDKLINYFTQNTVARLIGWNVHTILKHGLSAAINSIGEIGFRAIIREWMALDRVGDLDPKLSNEDFAMRTSRELPNRLRMAAGTMAGQWEQLQGKSNWRDWLAEKGAAPIGFFDLKSAIPTWTAAYKDSMINQLRDTGDFNKEAAISTADRAVRRAHGSTLQSSRPEAMQGGAIARMFTRLYLFFNTMYQRNYEAFWRTKAMAGEFKEGEYRKGLEDGRIALKMLVMGNLAPALIEELITPYPSSDKDSWGKWSAKMLAMGMSGMIPVVREAVHAWVGGYPSVLGIADTGLQDVSKLVADLEHGARAFDNEHGGKTLKEMNAVIGTLFGYTNDEIGRVAKWGWDVTHPNKETPRSLYEHARAITTGHARKKQ